MKTTSLFGALATSLLMATGLTPASAADMTQERALNAAKEPQNWLLHYGNYQGHRFSPLKDINTDTVKNLKPLFTVADAIRNVDMKALDLFSVAAEAHFQFEAIIPGGISFRSIECDESGNFGGQALLDVGRSERHAAHRNAAMFGRD